MRGAALPCIARSFRLGLVISLPNPSHPPCHGTQLNPRCSTPRRGERFLPHTRAFAPRCFSDGFFFWFICADQRERGATSRGIAGSGQGEHSPSSSSLRAHALKTLLLPLFVLIEISIRRGGLMCFGFCGFSGARSETSSCAAAYVRGRVEIADIKPR